jgi:septal ring factor EnvC (AmiA/AmiB activator)
LEQKEKHRGHEESAYEVMVKQEKIVEKWKNEHKQTVDYFEQQIKHLQVENRLLKDKTIQLKSTITVLREERRADQPEKGPQTKSAPGAEKPRSNSRKRDGSKGSRK